MRRTVRTILAAWIVMGPGHAWAQSPSTPEQSVNDEYRITAFPTHPLLGPVTGFGYLGYVNNTGKDVTTYYLGWPGAIYKPVKWLEAWTGLIYVWNDVTNGSDTRELRPFVGGKVYLPNRVHMNIYNLTRVEWRRITTKDTGELDKRVRVRSRFGFEAPLSERPWKEQTFYMLGDFESMYQTSTHAIDTVRARAGLGYITNQHVRVEFIYHLQLSRKDAHDPLAYSDNIFRVNFKIGIKKGLLQRLSGAEPD